jgi:hypothetical protein
MYKPRERERENEMYVPKLNTAKAAPLDAGGNKSLIIDVENGVIID